MEEEKYLKDKKASEINKVTANDLRKKITDLQQNIKLKKNSVQNLKFKSTSLKDSFNSYKSERGALDQKDKIAALSEKDMKEYIKLLRVLKAGIKSSQTIRPESSEYKTAFDKRHEKLVSDIDSSGLKLNDKLSDLHSKLSATESKVSKSVASINQKIDKKERIKDECRVVDRNVSSLADTIDSKLGKQLQELAIIIKRKSMLKSDAKLIDSDIIEFKASLRNLEGEYDNIEILKYTNIVTKKKIRFLDYLKSRLDKSIHSRDKILRAINQTHKLSIPQFSIDGENPNKSKIMQTLLNSIQEYKNEERFLKSDIDRLHIELEENSSILDTLQNQTDPRSSSLGK